MQRFRFNAFLAKFFALLMVAAALHGCTMPTEASITRSFRGFFGVIQGLGQL